VTEGLDGLRERLAGYAALGARFAKWRAVFTIGETLPSRACVQANAHALARYAALCQEAELVPIVEPEVLMAGEHPLSRCGEVTEHVLRELFSQLHTQGVLLEGMLLKTNMVLLGLPARSSRRRGGCRGDDLLPAPGPPAAIAGIVYLSEGQSGDLATARPPPPWPVAFSYGRAMQQPALSI